MHKRATKHDAASGTMEAYDGTARQVIAARAQGELIEMLARLVLANVDRAAAVCDGEAAQRRSGRHDSHELTQNSRRGRRSSSAATRSDSQRYGET